jgi:hypothetical protein
MRLFSAVAILILCVLLPCVAQQQSKTPKNATEGQNKTQPQSPPTPPPALVQGEGNATPNQDNHNRDKTDPSSDPHRSIDIINTISTGIMALFTVGVFILVYFQLRAYKSKERAWMIMEMYRGPISDSSGHVRFSGDAKNLGETPAIILSARHDAKVLVEGEKLPILPPYLDKETADSTNEAIAPEGGMPVQWDITEGALDDINTGKATFYVFGRILYKDIFNERRETRYCFRYYPPKQGHDGTIHIGFFVEGPSEYQRMT